MHLTGVHLIGVYLMSVHLMGAYLMGVHHRMQPFLLSRTYVFAVGGSLARGPRPKRRSTPNWCGGIEWSSGQRPESARGGRRGCRKRAAQSSGSCAFIVPFMRSHAVEAVQGKVSEVFL